MTITDGITVLLAVTAWTARPAVPVPEPVAQVERIAPVLRGVASWYDWRPGEGAAGPQLRDLLGRDWRGQTVTVCGGNGCTPVRLTDWCQCYRGEPRERVIDLDVRSFSKLAPASAGITHVTIHP